MAPLRGDRAEELSKNDIIIAVMGPSGSGKSTFINIVAHSNVAVGHQLESCTSEISTIRLSAPDLADNDIVFVDIPGFDHTHSTEIAVLEMVANWLKTTYERRISLSGLLYFHRISDTRMGAASLSHLRTFEEICGRNAFQKVILVTTMWDKVDGCTGEFEEEKMKTKYWNKMLKSRSMTGRFLRTRESALRLIRPLISAANRRGPLLIQHEMVIMKKTLAETSAGQQLFTRAGTIVSHRREAIQRMQTELRGQNGDRTSLHDEHQVLNESVGEETRILNPSTGRRVLQMSERWFNKFLKTTVKAQGSGVDSTEDEATSVPEDDV